MKAETIGVMRQHVTIHVPLDEMKEWDVATITKFFNGLARMVAAVNPNNWNNPREQANTNQQGSS